MQPEVAPVVNPYPAPRQFPPGPQRLQAYPKAKASHEAVCRDSRVFYYTLTDLLGQLGISLKVPKNGGKRVDLHRLYVEVTRHGGLQVVIARKLFVQVCEPLGFSSTFTNKSTIIRKLYSSMLHHYEQVYYFHNEGKLVPPPDKGPSTPTRPSAHWPQHSAQPLGLPVAHKPPAPPALPLSLVHLKPADLVPALIKAQMLKTLHAPPAEHAKPAVHPVQAAPAAPPPKLYSPREIVCAAQLCELAQHADNNAGWDSSEPDSMVQLTPTTLAASQLCDLKNNRVKPTPVVLDTLLAPAASKRRSMDDQHNNVGPPPPPPAAARVVTRPEAAKPHSTLGDLQPPMSMKPAMPAPILASRPTAYAVVSASRPAAATSHQRPFTLAAPQPSIPAAAKSDCAHQVPSSSQGSLPAQLGQREVVRPVPNGTSKLPISVKQRVLAATTTGPARAAHMVMGYKDSAGIPTGPTARPATIAAPRTSFTGGAPRMLPHSYMAPSRPHAFYHHPNAMMDHSMMTMQAQAMHFPAPGAMMYPPSMHVPHQVVYVPYGYYPGAESMGYY